MIKLFAKNRLKSNSVSNIQKAFTIEVRCRKLKTVDIIRQFILFTFEFSKTSNLNSCLIVELLKETFQLFENLQNT